MSTIALQFKDRARKRAQAAKQDQLAADYEADTIRQAAEDYDQYQLTLNSLETDQKRLSGLAPGDKDHLKSNELIPKYLPYAQQYLDAGDSYRNLILVEVIIMLLDVAEIPEAMPFVEVATEQKQPMPQRFQKTNLPTFVADKVLVWAMAKIARGETHEPEFSATFEMMLEQSWKVPREVVAKYHKLAGDVDVKEVNPEHALEHYIRATEIDPVGAKCTTKINKLKKQLGR